uniref:Uncharacterized protein n=2 Tax=Biomphalaria glabrata TaxID=6526 RepID=A0A2C9M151_BIOGL
MPPPDRWECYCPMGKPIPSTSFIAFKVPLKETLLSKVEEKEKFSPAILLKTLEEQGHKLGAIIDLTYTWKYYEKQDFETSSIKHWKIFTKGHDVPSEGVFQKFAKAVKTAENTGVLIGVHCTHGVNRTGYLICRYMIEELNIEPDEAIALFNEARGHKLERENYLEDLRQRIKGKSSYDPNYVDPDDTNDNPKQRWRNNRSDHPDWRRQDRRFTNDYQNYDRCQYSGSNRGYQQSSYWYAEDSNNQYQQNYTWRKYGNDCMKNESREEKPYYDPWKRWDRSHDQTEHEDYTLDRYEEKYSYKSFYDNDSHTRRHLSESAQHSYKSFHDNDSHKRRHPSERAAISESPNSYFSESKRKKFEKCSDGDVKHKSFREEKDHIDNKTKRKVDDWGAQHKSLSRNYCSDKDDVKLLSHSLDSSEPNIKKFKTEVKHKDIIINDKSVRETDSSDFFLNSNLDLGEMVQTKSQEQSLDEKIQQSTEGESQSDYTTESFSQCADSTESRNEKSARKSEASHEQLLNTSCTQLSSNSSIDT